MIGTIQLDFERALARPGRLLMPLLTFLAPVLLLPMLSVHTQIDNAGRTVVIWLLMAMAMAAMIDDVLTEDWRCYWPDAWVAAGQALWIYVFGKMLATTLLRVLPLGIVLWLGGIFWGVRPDPAIALSLCLLAPGLSAGLLIVAIIGINASRVQALAPVLIVPLTAAPLMMGINASLDPNTPLFVLITAWTLLQMLVLVPLGTFLLHLWIAER